VYLLNSNTFITSPDLCVTDCGFTFTLWFFTWKLRKVLYDDGHVNVVRLRLLTAAINRPIVHSPGDICALSTTVEWYRQEEPNNSEKCLCQCHFIYHKPHMHWSGREHGPPRWEAGD
jgi:hypothetical protein